MCGNFGLLFIKNHFDNTGPEYGDSGVTVSGKRKGFDALEQEEDHFVKNRKVTFGTSENDTDDDEDRGKRQSSIKLSTSNDKLRNPLLILEAQAANTEIRGGQAGGYSSFEFEKIKNTFPAALHPVGETVHSPFRSSHSVGSSTHSRMIAAVAKNPKLNVVTHHASSSGGDTHSPLHSSNHDATVHSYQRNRTMSQTANYSHFEAEFVTVPVNTRVRTVARKRYPLATDLTAQFLQTRHNKPLELNNTFTVIAHTRFATSSANIVTELHPHEWSTFQSEVVWKFNTIVGKYERSAATMGVHITHNGDFDELEAYQQVLVNDEVGFWLARLLYAHNPAKSDSAKIAGLMELFRVQGRWGPAARLAWVRCVLTSSSDVSGGQLLSGEAPYSFPAPGFWTNWAIFLESHWAQHINNIVTTVVPPLEHTMAGKMFFYRLSEEGVAQLESALCAALADASSELCLTLGVNRWTPMKLKSFVHHTVRGFLKLDLYNAVTEFMGRAGGSFGLQVHCTLEPGVVLVASKGQPMSIAFDPDTPLVMFASEAEALAVPVRESGASLPVRVDLDGHGEIVRVGEPRALLEGRFRDKVDRASAGAARSGVGSGSASLIELESEMMGAAPPPETDTSAAAAKLLQQSVNRTLQVPLNSSTAAAVMAASNFSGDLLMAQQCLVLRCGVEIRSYILNRSAELTGAQLQERCVPMSAPERPHDSYADLVASDLADTPAVLNAIDKAWTDRASTQRIAGHALAVRLVECMKRRATENKDSIDLLIAGIEASLWLAEQAAADLRRVFPYLNVTTISSNKVLGLWDDDSSKVFFPTAEDHLERRVDQNTCVLLISQSGQTFGTLHATHKLANIVKDKLWILTGCSNSKMEFALADSYHRHGMQYNHDRVINNLSGHRPAEPSSVAVAAAWHTLTRFLMHLVYTTRTLVPSGRMVHDWVYTKSARVIQTFFRKHNCAMRRLGQSNCAGRVAGRLIGSSSGSGRSSNGSVMALASAYSHPPVLMRLTDGCIRDLNSLLVTNLIPNLCSIVGRDVKGRALDVNEIQSASAHHSLLQLTPVASTDPSRNSLAADLTDLLAGSQRDNSVHRALVSRGRAWAAHVSETWTVLVLAGLYILVSVGFGLPLFGLLGDAVVKILRHMGAPLGQGYLEFHARYPETIYNQHPGWMVCGLLLQLCDAVFFIYVGKNIARLLRLVQRRPYYARFGKRTIVIVDNPTVHQLLENFLSKLFSQAYSVVSVDVHGASGLDHFVHRFTHRVSRGVLIAVGRVDGRLCCLAKSEASTLLAVKQAAFIRNPDYPGESSGPEIVTIGHNPFQPNLGLASHVVLNSVTTMTPQDHRPSRVSVSRILKLNTLRGGGELDAVDLAVLKTTHTEWKRHRFLDMYLYNRLYYAEKPFTKAILKSLRYSMEYEMELRRRDQQRQLHKAIAAQGSSAGSSSKSQQWGPGGMGHSSLPLPPTQGVIQRGKAAQAMALSEEVLPYGVHHIDPAILAAKRSSADSSFLEFFMNNTQILRKMKNKKTTAVQNKSSDPAMILAFTAKLDDRTKTVIDRQVYVQQLYECRIASLERYVAFCVMFHAMAQHSCAPWLSVPWNISRSQSNLRVATTASPISASSGPHEETSRAVLGKARKAIGVLTRKVHTNF